jgi:hypothetical protein
VLAVVASGCFGVYAPVPSGAPIPTLTSTPLFTLPNVSDFVPLADGSMLFVDRCAGLEARHPDGSFSAYAPCTQPTTVTYTSLAMDPNFASNHLVYTCETDQARGGVVTQWHVAADLTSATPYGDIVVNIPACRQIRFKPGTGELFISGVADRILRVDQLGHALPGNAGIAFDPRIWSYSHDAGTLIAFANSGGGYAFESATNTARYLVRGPASLIAFTTGGPPSAALFLSGGAWKGLDGAIAYASSGSGLQARLPSISGAVNASRTPIQIVDPAAALTAAALAPNGDLYIGVYNPHINATMVSKVTPS